VHRVSSTSSSEAATPRRSDLKRFAATAALFCAGLTVATACAEIAAGRFMASRRSVAPVGSEVYVAQSLARTGDSRVKALMIGDSVARQLFPPGSEPNTSIRFLTTNQAVSLAGQYYLLRDALDAHTNVRRIILFYNPRAWSNNLDQVYTHDYFCGFFHRPDEIREVFGVTRNWGLLGAHVGRALLPNLAESNSWMSMSQARVLPPIKMANDKAVVFPVSDVSRHFLGRIHEIAERRGISLQIYPGPVSDEFVYRDEFRLYDAPFLYVPSDEFGPDGIHLKTPAAVSASRATLAARYALFIGAPGT
jgi:hypothetical protein